MNQPQQLDLAGFDRAPVVVIWETTRACDLACRHCRASATADRNPLELTTDEGLRLIRMVKEFADPGGRPPLLILTGGDPMKRSDVFTLVRFGVAKGITMGLSPSATPLMTRHKVFRFRDECLSCMAISLDGPDATSHDQFRGVEGSYAKTRDMIDWSSEAGIPLQIHTTISRFNSHRLQELGEMMLSLPAIRTWSLFFLVPTGRGRTEDMIGPAETEFVLNWLYDFSRIAPFDVRTTAAQHYRRVVLQRRARERQEAFARFGVQGLADLQAAARDNRLRGNSLPGNGVMGAPKGVNDGNGFVFVAYNGEVQPSGFLPLRAGNVRWQNLVSIYRFSPLFQRLRNPDLLKGKCGRCEFRRLCGGSRARAFAMTGDYLEAETCCGYEPGKR